MTRPRILRWAAVVLVIVPTVLAWMALRRAHNRRHAALLAPGVPEGLAQSRAARVIDLRYALSFTIPERRDAAVAGRARITFTLRETARPLALDFEPTGAGRIRRVEAGGIALGQPLVDGHLVVPVSALRDGPNALTIDFDAGDAPLNRSNDFLYTIFVPARAHEAFPCFDQPDLKARWTLTLDVPDGWESVANGAEVSRESHDGRLRVVFAETAPIPSYLFAFAAGRFSVERAERGGRGFRMLHRETDAAKVARNREAIFDLHATALDWLERYTGIPYPFGKFDFVLVPAFQFSGMEHPGAIFYNALSLLLDESATQNQKLARASTISHETAHMWFGDLVTMRWFSDVWMKEVFANFMAAKIVNPSFPEINHELRFFLEYYPSAYEVDRTAGTNPIRQPLDNLKNAGTLYGPIIYDKAPIVMRQLETLIGPDTLREGLQEYLREHAFGNASWTDLIALLGARTPEDLPRWSHAWVEEAGRPIITTTMDIENDRIANLAFSVRDPNPRRGLTWTEHLQVALGYVDRVQLVPIELGGARGDVPSVRGWPAPLFVLPNGGGVGYGEFHLDRRSLMWLSTHLPDVADPLTRGSAWVTLWDAVLDGELPSERFINLAIEGLPHETDELNIQRILGYLEHAYWKFTPDSRRNGRAADIEQVLRRGLIGARTTSLKGAYFAALRDVALTPPTVAWLTRVWNGNEAIAGLTLGENDYITIAKELAVRGAPTSEAMLMQQVERTKNPDRRARLLFVVSALSADPAERRRFFTSLGDLANRRHEPWVLDGLHYLHHPLRAADALQYIRPSLERLQDIQQTGDIFFPKRWMDETLSGHRSTDAAHIVRRFLDSAPPSYPDRLRGIIESSADDLFRAATTVH